MRGRLIALLAAALLVVGLLAVPGLATFSDTDSDSARSEAEISVVDCVVESSKDISYVAFLDSGEELDKFNVNAPTYDLTGYEDIDDVDSVRVKSGETVESFGVDCGDDTAGADEEPTEEPTEDDTTGDDEDDTTGGDDETTGDDEDDATQPDEVENHNDKANANSQAVITLSGCTLNSSKDISYIAFLTDGEQVDKIEDVDSESYDLSGYDGIEDIDAVRVKAGTTVASFSVSCGVDDTDGTEGDDTTNNDTTNDEDSTGDDEATDGDDATEDDDSTEQDATDGEDTTEEHDDDVVKDDEDTDDSDSDSDEEDDTETDDDEDWDGGHEHQDDEELDDDDD